MKPKRKRAKPTAPLPPAPSAAAVSSVFGNDDLLRELLLRLGFPTCLIRAASDPAFLRQFRELHPPRLLGFYVEIGSGLSQRLRFVAMPMLPPELAAVIRSRFHLGNRYFAVSDCRNGRLILHTLGRYEVCSPLHPARAAAAVPDLYDEFHTFYRPLLPEGAGDRTVVALVRNRHKGWFHLSDSQAGAWGKCRASHLVQLPEEWRMCAFGLLANGKVCMYRRVAYILGLDLASSGFFQIKLPEGVEYESDLNFEMSCSDGSGFYLICVKDFQVLVWRHSTGCSTGNWELVDSIDLCQSKVLSPLFCQSRDPVVQVAVVGDNADFVFFQIEHEVFYMHFKSREVEKLYESHDSELDFNIYPFMMVWPLTFPTLNDGRELVA